MINDSLKSEDDKDDVLSKFDESDEYCPRCDNHYVIPAVTPEDKGKLVVEFE